VLIVTLAVLDQVVVDELAAVGVNAQEREGKLNTNSLQCGDHADLSATHHRPPLRPTGAEISSAQRPDPFADRELAAVRDQVDLELRAAPTCSSARWVRSNAGPK